MKRCAMILLACLLLTGCGKKETTQNDAVPMDETEILLTVDGREVPAWRYLCWLRHACQQVQEQYAAAGQAVDWELPVEGETLAELVKRQALADTVLYATVENWAERYGCQGQREVESQPLPLPGLTAEQEWELQAVGSLYAALYDLYETEGSVLAPSGEQLAAFSEESGLLTLDRILIAAGEDREAARQRVAEMFSRLNGAENPLKEFAVLAAEGDDPAGPRQSKASGWSKKLLAAAGSLGVGQYSGILESDEGFSILMRLEPELTETKAAYFDFLLQQAAEDAEVRLLPRYDDLDPANLMRAETEKLT